MLVPLIYQTAQRIVQHTCCLRYFIVIARYEIAEMKADISQRNA
jgi:hypothetical protein